MGGGSGVGGREWVGWVGARGDRPASQAASRLCCRVPAAHAAGQHSTWRPPGRRAFRAGQGRAAHSAAAPPLARQRVAALGAHAVVRPLPAAPPRCPPRRRRCRRHRCCRHGAGVIARVVDRSRGGCCSLESAGCKGGGESLPPRLRVKRMSLRGPSRGSQGGRTREGEWAGRAPESMQALAGTQLSPAHPPTARPLTPSSGSAAATAAALAASSSARRRRRRRTAA